MRKTLRLPDAYRFPGFRPEAIVRGIFGDPKARIQHARVVVQGRLSSLERKTSEPIAYLAGQERKPVQNFVGAGAWDDEAFMTELRGHVREEIGEADAVLVLDPSAFAKKGTAGQCLSQFKLRHLFSGVDEFAGNVPLRIERLVTAPVRAPHHGVDDDRCAVIQVAGRVVAQDDGISDAFGVPTHSPKREQVVPIQTGVTDLHAHPALGHVRFGLLSDLQRCEWIVGSSVRGVNGEHRPASILRETDTQGMISGDAIFSPSRPKKNRSVTG
jgi:hypothetical protein